ncbi:glycerate kinase [Cohnella zeiphila]|uniref:Glycerate kinase n=1 Tax=Cohnella zeiphila TaxID=2761120 RepID=A0A7X0SMY3_9BACL|nr:glycerate kinase [Cohnella zeiphila]MBB6731834.1 glycerate kinase [Cohnella zeiphila]
MKIVLAPDSYKGSLSAIEACRAMEEGIRRALPDADIVAVPMADGGEGTAQSLVDAMGGRFREATVANPLGEPVLAKYGILEDGSTAVIEMAEASGLTLIPEAGRNPLLTTTFGTGQLIADALAQGCRRFVICLGGSATNDGGAGMVQALGGRLLDERGEELPYGGGYLDRLRELDVSGMDPRLKECEFSVACDVDNPLCGPRGASVVYGPQKGATPEMVDALDRNLEIWGRMIESKLGVPVLDAPGAGAAGGLGAAVLAFLNGELRRGIELVVDAGRLAEKVQGASLVLTGEGRSDFQTAMGKTPYGVALTARAQGVPVVLISGSIGPGIEALYEHGVTSVFSAANGPMRLEEAMANAYGLLADSAERVIRLYSASLGRR